MRKFLLILLSLAFVYAEDCSVYYYYEKSYIKASENSSFNNRGIYYSNLSIAYGMLYRNCILRKNKK